MVPSLPPLLLLGALGAKALAAAATRGGVPARAAAGLALAVLAGASAFASPPLAASEWFDPRTTPVQRRFNRDNYTFARFLERWTEPSTRVAVHWGGVPPYFSHRPAVDVLGKSDRHIAKLRVERFRPGHSKWDWDYVLDERRPDVLRAPSRGLGEREDFRERYVKVLASGRLEFFMHEDSLGKLRTRSGVVVDLRSGERRRLGPERPSR